MTNKGLSFKLIEKSVDSVKLELEFSKEYPYFEGHFEGFPILPALLQVHHAIEWSREYFVNIKNPSTINSIKFNRPITPSMKVNLNLNFDEVKKQIRFSYTLDEDLLSGGAMNI